MWVENLWTICFSSQANLSEQQVASNTLVRALMTTVCYSAIICKKNQGDGGARVGLADKWWEGGFCVYLLVVDQAEGALVHLKSCLLPCS